MPLHLKTISEGAQARLAAARRFYRERPAGDPAMGRRKRRVEPLDTIWEVPDAARDRMEGILAECYPPKKIGRPRADLRKVFNGIIYRLRSGVQWNHLPREFGDDSTVHRWFQRWAEDGVFEELWTILLLECDELGGVEWNWQRTAAWARPVLGGRNGTEPDRSCQERHQEERRERRERLPHWRHDRGSERQRHQAPRGNSGGRGRRAPGRRAASLP